MKTNLPVMLSAFVGTLFFAFSDPAQVADNAPYTLEQAVSAGGGSSAGGTFSVTGAVGQAVAGTTSTNSPFTVHGGFFTPPVLAPTAAGATISGRVKTSAGKGIRNILITMTNSGGATRTVLSSMFGGFRFTDVPAGETYVLSVSGKRFTFVQPVQIYSILGDIEDVIFIGEAGQLQNP